MADSTPQTTAVIDITVTTTDSTITTTFTADSSTTAIPIIVETTSTVLIRIVTRIRIEVCLFIIGAIMDCLFPVRGASLSGGRWGSGPPKVMSSTRLSWPRTEVGCYLKHMFIINNLYSP